MSTLTRDGAVNIGTLDVLTEKPTEVRLDSCVAYAPCHFAFRDPDNDANMMQKHDET